MTIKAILFDVNGTMVDINTDEGREDIYRGLSRYLRYQGLHIHRWELRDAYFQALSAQKKARGEEHPEFDAVALWKSLLEDLMSRPGTASGRGAGAGPGGGRRAGPRLSRAKLAAMPLFLAEMYRALSMNRLELYPGVRTVLDELALRYPLAVVSDGQSAWAVPELTTVGLDGYFRKVAVSGDFGFRKPDPRLFRKALDALRVAPHEAVYVGNDLYRDVFGAGRLGLKTVFFASNQGQWNREGVNPDYIIHHFGQLPEAVRFLESR